MAITDAKDLGKALQREENLIEIEGELAGEVIKIKATGSVAWAIAIGALGIAVCAVLAAPATCGTSLIVSLTATGGAGLVLGGPTAAIALTIAVRAGGVGALNKLREYDLKKISSDNVVLRRR